MANDQENADAQEGGEDKTSEENNDSEQSPEELKQELEKLKKENKTLNEQRKHKEKKLKQLQEALSDDTSEQDDSDSDSGTEETDFDRIVNVTTKIGGLEPDEVNEMRSKAKDLGVSPEKFLDSEVGQKYLQSYRSEKQVEESTPAPSNRGITVNKKSFDEMSNEERKQNWDKIVNPQQGGNSVE